jgi:hypothetical protein
MEFEDYVDMFRDIKQYMESNPDCEIVKNDDPMNLLVGFKDTKTEKTWYIFVARGRGAPKEAREITLSDVKIKNELIKNFNL